MKNITTSLALAKKLKKAGWKKETVFYWNTADNEITTSEDFYNKIASETGGHLKYLPDWVIPAPTASEILEEIARQTDFTFEINYDGLSKEFYIFFKGEYFNAKTPTNTLAKIYIYLAENGLLK